MGDQKKKFKEKKKFFKTLNDIHKGIETNFAKRLWNLIDRMEGNKFKKNQRKLKTTQKIISSRTPKNKSKQLKKEIKLGETYKGIISHVCENKIFVKLIEIENKPEG